MFASLTPVALNIAVTSELTIEKGHDIAMEVRHQLLHYLRYLSNVIILIDALHTSGEQYHFINEHSHV